MEIRSSLPAVHARRQMNIANEKLQKASERLSSGYRVNSAADDTAGLAVSEKLRSQMKGLKQAARNCQDGINLVQTFEGALNETDSILQRCKELAAESANGEYNDPVDRKALQLEYDQLVKEINQISDTDFNGVFMLNGNPTIQYQDVEYSIPVATDSYSPVFDENGNPVLDVESYRLNAEYVGIPFNSAGNVAPTYRVGGKTVETEYGGTTSYFRITISGKFPDENGDETTKEISVLTPNNDPNHPGVDISITRSGPDGDGAYTCKKVVAESTDSDIKIMLITKATPQYEYLTNASGQPVLDADGQRVPISMQWKIDYQLKMADGSNTNFKLESANINLHSDTKWNSDRLERYYTPDIEDGFLDHEVVYDPLSIDSFSCFYNPPAGTELSEDNMVFKDVSNRVNFDMSPSGPDKVKLGKWNDKTGDKLTPLGPISPGNDLAYTLYWEGKEPVNGVVSFSAGSRGMSNSNGDTNIWPKPEIDYITEIVTNAVTKYNDDVDLVIQTGTRTKDSVQFTFEYELRDTGDLKADLNCSSAGLGVDKLSIGTQTDANSAIDMIDHALNKVSMVRAGFGAAQTRLAYKINDLTNTNENITAAESGIRDADMATEYSDYTKAQIVSNAAQSMLAQTMQLPRSILSLIS